MSKIIIFDSECNSLDTENGFIMELAWALFDVESWRCLKACSQLINWPTAYAVHPDALAVTGLTSEFCHAHGDTPQKVLGNFILDSESADYIAGHNLLSYDEPMLRTNVQRGCLFPLSDSDYDDALKIDTLLDCEFPSHMKTHALKYLALEHNYVLMGAHEALNDVLATAHILKQYDFKRVTEIARTPIVTITSKIDWLDTAAREKIKGSRFYWNPKQKLWEKKTREFYLPGIQMSLGSDIQLCIS
jgi:DNA polymerase III alpha subunit (gram-positive type)